MLRDAPAENRSAVRDPLWKHVYVNDALSEALLSAPFMRLTRILQLGPTHLVYPGATHTRAAHSIGVYSVACRLLDVLRARGADSWTTPCGCASFRAAALFHDLGHFPYTHSLKELPLASHESLSAEAVLRDPLCTHIRRSGGAPEQTAAIIDAAIAADDTETLFFRRLLSGVLDPDKIDYLNRDAYFCGVPYGIQDTDYIFAQLLPDRDKGVVLESAALSAVENVLFSKYLMYRSVYWHRQVRVATALMKKAVFAALERGLLRAEQLYNADDYAIHALLARHGGSAAFPEYGCAQAVQSGRLYHIIYEVPFDDGNSRHRILEHMRERTEAEARIAERLGIAPHQLVIDVPERISFESSLWICDEGVSFAESSTVFSSETVASFTGTLRKIRCAAAVPVGKDSKTVIADFI